MLRAPWTPLEPDVQSRAFERARRAAKRRPWGAIGAIGIAAAAAVGLTITMIERPPANGDGNGALRIEVVRGTADIAVEGAWSAAVSDTRVELPVTLRAATQSSLRARTTSGARLDIEEGTIVEVHARTVRVARGGVRHTVVPGHGGYRVQLGGDVEVVVTGTVFWTGSSGSDAAVCVLEGSVIVTHRDVETARLEAGQGWRSSEAAPAFASDLPCGAREATVVSPTRPEPSPARAEETLSSAPAGPRAPRQARALAEEVPSVRAESVHCAQASDPATCYRTAADGDGLAAENALYHLGRLHRRERRLRDALEAWREYARRFPEGVLVVEVRLAELETLLATGSPEALARADAFLAAHGASAHAAEIHVVRATLRHRAGNHADALEDYEAALGRQLPTHRRDESLFGRASCLDALGRDREAVGAYRAYLDAFPEGRFAARARMRIRAR